MDWTQVFVILGVFLGAFLWLASKIDGVRTDVTKEIQNNAKEIQNNAKEIQNIRADLTKEIQKNREDILWIKFRLDPNEHPDWRKKEESKEESK